MGLLSSHSFLESYHERGASAAPRFRSGETLSNGGGQLVAQMRRLRCQAPRRIVVAGIHETRVASPQHQFVARLVHLQLARHRPVKSCVKFDFAASFRYAQQRHVGKNKQNVSAKR